MLWTMIWKKSNKEFKIHLKLRLWVQNLLGTKELTVLLLKITLKPFKTCKVRSRIPKKRSLVTMEAIKLKKVTTHLALEI